MTASKQLYALNLLAEISFVGVVKAKVHLERNGKTYG